MGTIKVKLRPSTVEGKPGTIFYSVTQKGKIKQVTTKIHVHPSNWNADSQSLTIIEDESCLLQNKIHADVALLEKIIRELDTKKGDYTVDDIISQFRDPQRYISVIDFFEDQIMFLKECKRHGTALNYRIVLNALQSFLNGRELYFTELSVGFIERFADHLKIKGLVRNSISFYMRVFRAVFNKAVRLGYTEQNFPFRAEYTGIDKTRKRAVDANIVSNLIHLDLTSKRSLALSRDMFVFSFFTRGMSYIDIAYLRKTDIHENVITYSRHKTGHYMRVRIEPCMDEIIKRYKDAVKDTPYVFPILKEEEPEKYYLEYKSALRVYNERLKRLSKILKISPTISSYTARHTWATMAGNHNVPISVISAGMGHSSEKNNRNLSKLDREL